MSSLFNLDADYYQWLSDLKNKIRSSQLNAALRVNAELLNLYWELGKAIAEKQQKSNWGDKIINQLSTDLTAEFKEIKGFSRTNLFNIRKWYQFYTQSPELVQQSVGLIKVSEKNVHQGIVQETISQFPMILGKIPWGHHIQIFTKCLSPEEALFYVQETIKYNWSREVLTKQINSDLFKRKSNILSNFEYTLPKPLSDLARETLKNSYTFDFLGLGENIQERHLENALIQHIKKFMLELGRGFAYVGNQYNIRLNGNDFYLDLLFYNYHLYCFVVFELKVGEFKPEYAGKLNFYVNAINDKIKGEHDKPTIGVLLCKTPNETVIKFSLKGVSTPIGVADYELSKALPKYLKTEMPTVEELEQELERESKKLKKPIDVKIENLKSFVDSFGKSEMQAVIPNNIKDDLFTYTLPALKQKLEIILADIQAMFQISQVTIMCNNKLYKDMSQHEIFGEFQIELENGAIRSIGLHASFIGFKFGGSNAFASSYTLSFIFDSFIYLVGPENPRKEIWVEKRYDEKWSDSDVDDLSERWAEWIIDQIKEEVSRTK